MSEEEPGQKQRGIQSVEIGLRVLSALSAIRAPAALSTVAQASSLSASQAHRYLRSLIAAGMVKQEERSGFYDLDAGAIRLGLSALARLNVLARADEVFAAFARDSGRTCLIAVWGDAGPTVVRWFPGYPPVITSLAIGSVMPLLSSATGRVFLAFGDRRLVEAQACRERSGTRILKTVDDLRRDVRSAMAARVEGDLIPGLRASSVPAFDLQGRLVLAATAIASATTDAAADERIERELQAAGQALTHSLGGLWPPKGLGPTTGT